MNMISKFERFDQTIDDEEYKKKKKELLYTIRLDMYNNRQIVINTKNLYENQQKQKLIN